MIGNDPKGTAKLDSASSDGLSGTEDSISYRIGEIERHHHNTEKWFGMALVADGENHVADRMNVANNPFTLTAGDNDFGPWVQILGPEDTPVHSWGVKFDAHRIMIKNTNSTDEFVLQVISGESAGIAAKLLAEEFSETPYISASNNNDSGIADILVRRTSVSEKVWSRARCINANGSILSFYFGIHEYEG